MIQNRGTRRPRIGLYCLGTGTGGPWRYVHSLVAHLDPAEFDLTLYSHLAGPYERRPAVRVVPLELGAAPKSASAALGSGPVANAVGVRRAVRRFVPAAARLWAGYSKEVLHLARVIRRHPVDLFHTQYVGCEESPLAAALARVPVVLGTFHVGPSVDLHQVRSGPAHRMFEMASNRCLSVGIAVSRAVRREWLDRTHIPPGRVPVMYNGIDPEHFRRRAAPAQARGELGFPGDVGPVIGSVGRLDEGKGFRYLLDAAARLRVTHPDLKVYLAGDGPDRPALEAQANRLAIRDAVRFLGFRSHVQGVLDALDVFVHPTLSDALPYSVMEAMAAELPVVGTAVGGVPETVVDGTTGLLVPPRNPARLAEAIRQLLCSPDLRARMGAAGRERVVRSFHERDMVRRTIQLYRDMLRTGRAAVRRHG